MDPEGGHPARPGVREVADGIFLYTTRVYDEVGATSGGAGPTFVYEVESARADRMGVSFGIDFSASTNFIILPSVPAPAPTPATETITTTVTAMATAAAAEVAGSPTPNKNVHQQEECATPGGKDSKVGVDGGEARGSKENSDISEVDSKHPATGGRGVGEKDSAAPLRGEVPSVMSARVSTKAFCRTLVARIAIRDSEVGGAIKTTCSWELLEPPERRRSTGQDDAVATQSDCDSHATNISRQLSLAQSLGLAGDDQHGVLRGAADRAEEVVKRCRMHGAFYVDQDFPPNDSSLGPTLAATDLITWRRPAQFPGATTTAATAAFGGYGPPRPSDVRPCAFAMDASLACALAALAERPRLVSAALCGRVEQVVSMTSTGIKDGGRGDGGGEGKGFRTESGAPRRRSLGNDNSEWDRTASKRTKATAAAAKASTAASQAGMFSARLCVDGIWKEYVLDDYFPCLSSWSEGFPGGCTSSSRNRSSNGGGVGSAGGPCLSRAHGPALWVSMLEKAYARAVGSYSEALGGCCLSLGRGAKGETGGPGVVGMASATGAVARPANILGVFTGAPVLQVELSGARLDAGEEEAGRSRGSDCTDGKQAANVLWESIVSWIQQGWLVCLSTAAPVRKDPKKVRSQSGDGIGPASGLWKDGLRVGNAYTVLKTADFGNDNRLVQIRGPLPAKKGWRGKWAEDSPLWETVPKAFFSVRVATAETHSRINRPSAGTENPSERPRQTYSGTRGTAEDGGAFWVSVEEAVSAFVEVGVCMTPLSPSKVSESFIGRRHLHGLELRTGQSSVWAREMRRRVFFTRRSRRARRQRGCGRPDSGAGRPVTQIGRKQQEDSGGEEEGVVAWIPSQIYALSVYKTSSMFFSLYQKRSGGGNERLCRDAGVTVLRVGDGCEPEVVASTGNPAQAAVSTGVVLTPGRYVVIPSHTGCLTAGGDSGKVRSEVGVIQQHPIGHPIGQSDEDRNPATNVELHSVTDEESLIPATVRKEKKQPLHDESHGSVWGSESKKGNTTAQREGRQRREEQHQENANSSFSRRDVRAGLMAMFDGLDADCDGVLCREELDAFLRATEGLPLQEGVFTWLVQSFSPCLQPRDPSCEASVVGDTETPSWCGAEKQRRRRRRRDQRAPAGIDDGDDVAASLGLCLTRRGFVDMYRYIWQAAGRDLEVILRDLRVAGCIAEALPAEEEERFRLNEDRFSVVLTVHSDTSGFDFLAQPPDRKLLEAALLLPVQRWGHVSPLDTGPQVPRKKSRGRECGSAGEGLSDQHQEQSNAYSEPDKDDRNGETDCLTTRVAPHAVDNEDGDVKVKTDVDSISRTARNNDGAVHRGFNNGRGNYRDECTERRNTGLLLSVRPGPRGAEKAVTFALQSPTSTGRRNGGMFITARLDCSGSINASPVPGSIGLSREVTLRPGQSKVIQHLVPADPQKPWSWKYAVTVVRSASEIKSKG